VGGDDVAGVEGDVAGGEDDVAGAGAVAGAGEWAEAEAGVAVLSGGDNGDLLP
jgi:hypothetical protein